MEETACYNFDQYMKKVYVAMSGGVDSSVSAALLKEQGYDVYGVMLRLWKGGQGQPEIEANYQNSLENARSVANLLSIPFEVIDATEEFRQKVVYYFLISHQNGVTPNPCFVCNQNIKWGLLLRLVQTRGADFLATGHYAIITRSNDGIAELRMGVDQKKDQSYILAGLKQEQLNFGLLPLGKMTKVEVRRIAERYGFPNHSLSDSQDLCFMGSLDQSEFLKIYADEINSPGIIRNLQGVVIGTHDGLSNYTIGQRKGLGAGNSGPVYVVRKDLINNEIIIGGKEDLGQDEIEINQVNWSSCKEPELGKTYSVKIRYKATLVNGKVEKKDCDNYLIYLDSPVRDATPGQIAVIYDQDRVLGSGIIYLTHRRVR
jgi:tRNA-uridine 2-sulfurtransferase